MLRPDGAVSAGLKRYINKEFRELPHLATAYDPLDMAHRDKVKRGQKATRINKKKLMLSQRKQQTMKKQHSRKMSIAYGGSPDPLCPSILTNDGEAESGGRGNESYRPEEGEDEFVEPELSTTQLNAMSLIASQTTLSPERAKKPFSDSSLFNALLESQVSGETTEWELGEML